MRKFPRNSKVGVILAVLLLCLSMGVSAQGEQPESLFDISIKALREQGRVTAESGVQASGFAAVYDGGTRFLVATATGHRDGAFASPVEAVQVLDDTLAVAFGEQTVYQLNLVGGTAEAVDVGGYAGFTQVGITPGGQSTEMCMLGAHWVGRNPAATVFSVRTEGGKVVATFNENCAQLIPLNSVNLVRVDEFVRAGLPDDNVAHTVNNQITENGLKFIVSANAFTLTNTAGSVDPWKPFPGIANPGDFRVFVVDPLNGITILTHTMNISKGVFNADQFTFSVAEAGANTLLIGAKQAEASHYNAQILYGVTTTTKTATVVELKGAVLSTSGYVDNNDTLAQWLYIENEEAIVVDMLEDGISALVN